MSDELPKPSWGIERWATPLNMSQNEIEIVKRIRARISTIVPDRLILVMAFNRRFDEQATVDRLEAFWVYDILC